MFPQRKYYSKVEHDFCITYKQRTSAYNMRAFHYHNVYELYFFTSGERLLFYKDHLYHVSEGDIVFVRKDELHCFTDADTYGHSFFLVDFQDEFLLNLGIDNINLSECFEKEIIVVSLPLNKRSAIRAKFQELLEEFNGTMPHREVQIKLKLASILISLSISQDMYGEKQEAFYQKQFIVSKAMKFINENYQKKISLDEIADHVQYSRNYFCEYFKKYSGFTIVEYTNNIRVQKAQTYLSNTKLSITEIAGLCGFDSSTHFGRVFRKVTGMSPLQFRKRTILL